MNRNVSISIIALCIRNVRQIHPRLPAAATERIHATDALGGVLL